MSQQIFIAAKPFHRESETTDNEELYLTCLSQEQTLSLYLQGVVCSSGANN